MSNKPGDVTRLLIHWSEGSSKAFDQLLPLIHRDIHRLAERYLRKERANHTLQPTALIHEAYFRLVDQKQVSWRNRLHFFGIAAQAMRRILVDHARKHRAEKRGGPDTVLQLTDEPRDQRSVDVMALEDALKDLEKRAPRQSKIVELRYFAGLTIEETAVLLSISVATVKLDWSLARAWLYRKLNNS